MKEYYCWKCDASMPFFEEEEWEKLLPVLRGATEEVKRVREAHGYDLKTARAIVIKETAPKIEAITGVPNLDYEPLYHHQLAAWGEECPSCGHLLRTSKAKYCANCGQGA